MPGPQPGTGKPEVAERWLAIACLGAEEKEAAAAPATTTERIRTWNASFIVSYPSLENLTQSVCLMTLLW
jgi:hypothetical protein